jgi:outer membrane protein insertion porin family
MADTGFLRRHRHRPPRRARWSLVPWHRERLLVPWCRVAPPGAAPAAAPPMIEPPPVAGGGDAASGDADNAPQLTGRISRINIKGNVHLSTLAIQAVLSQKVGQPYTARGADLDRDAIKNMGFFNGDVGLTAVNNTEGGVDETYTVVENPLVKKIVFTANTPSGVPSIAPSILLSRMQTKAGTVLNSNLLVKDIDALFNHNTGYVSSQGYIMDVSADINLDPNNNTLTIPLIEAYIQGIKITGNKKTKTVVVTREMRSQSGQVLNQKLLNADLTRVYNLGLFDTVGPADIEPTDVGKVILNIPVTEKRSGQVSVGVGYSSTEKVVGRAELAENNFRGLGERVSLQYEVGGISSQTSVDLGFFEPYLDKRHTSLSLDLYNKVIYRFSSDVFNSNLAQTGNTSQYSENHEGLTATVARPVSLYSSIGLTFREETVHTVNADVPLSDTFIRQDGSVGAVGVQFTNNTKDQDISPASGGYRSFSYDQGIANTTTVGNSPSPLMPGRHDFGKLGIDLRQYISLQGPRKASNIREPKRVFATRLLLGFANRDIPFFEQYFLGGADNLRGYQTDQYWGNNLVLGQAELRLPVGKGENFQAVVLGDIGDAWGSIYTGPGLPQHSNLELRGDYGVGIRLVTPIGPIRLDYAIPTTGGGGGRTQFSIGQSF